MSSHDILTLMNAAAALLLMGVSVPLMQGRIPRNGLYGFRTARTLASDEVWYPANRYSGRCLLWAGAAMAVGAATLRVFGAGLSTDAFAWAGLGVTCAPLCVALLMSVRYLRDL